MHPRPSEVRESLRRAYAREAPRRRAATERARAALPALVEVLVREFDVRRVVLVGSLPRGLFDEGSDIDLVVAGLPESHYLAAYDRLNESSPIPVDLQREEEAGPFTLRAVREHGEVLHGA